MYESVLVTQVMSGTPLLIAYLSLSYIHLPLSSSVPKGICFWPSHTSLILHRMPFRFVAFLGDVQ